MDPMGFLLVGEERSGPIIPRRLSLLGYQRRNSDFRTWSDDQGRSYQSVQGGQLNWHAERSRQTKKVDRGESFPGNSIVVDDRTSHRTFRRRHSGTLNGSTNVGVKTGRSRVGGPELCV